MAPAADEDMTMSDRYLAALYDLTEPMGDAEPAIHDYLPTLQDAIDWLAEQTGEDPATLLWSHEEDGPDLVSWLTTDIKLTISELDD